jgi:hypothetical protein
MGVGQQAPEGGEHRAGPADTVAGSEIADELAQPRWRLGQPGGQVLAADEGPVGMTLPARRAQAEPGVALHPSARGTGPWLLGLPRP